MKCQATETLERQLEECTHQLEAARRVRTRLLTATHDLRQPMHALGLFVAELQGLVCEGEQKRIIGHIEAAVSALRERFNGWIELTKVEAADSDPNSKDNLADSPTPVRPSLDRTNGKVIVVIDDNLQVLDGTCGLLHSWGCSVVTGTSSSDAIAWIVNQQQQPDLIISDFRLSDGKSGFDAIAELRSAFSNSIPAFLVSGDTSPALLHKAQARGFHMLHKPVDPMTLRAMLNRIFK